MLQKFPFADSILKDIGFMNPPKKHSFTADNGKFRNYKYYIFIYIYIYICKFS